MTRKVLHDCTILIVYMPFESHIRKERATNSKANNRFIIKIKFLWEKKSTYFIIQVEVQ